MITASFWKLLHRTMWNLHYTEECRNVCCNMWTLPNILWKIDTCQIYRNNLPALVVGNLEVHCVLWNNTQYSQCIAWEICPEWDGHLEKANWPCFMLYQVFHNPPFHDAQSFASLIVPGLNLNYTWCHTPQWYRPCGTMLHYMIYIHKWKYYFNSLYSFYPEAVRNSQWVQFVKFYFFC